MGSSKTPIIWLNIRQGLDTQFSKTLPKVVLGQHI